MKNKTSLVTSLVSFATWFAIIILLFSLFPNNTPWQVWVTIFLVLIYGLLNYAEGVFKND